VKLAAGTRTSQRQTPFPDNHPARVAKQGASVLMSIQSSTTTEGEKKGQTGKGGCSSQKLLGKKGVVSHTPGK